jgi:cellulose biosynthesis protein BcsQ
MRVVTFYSFKGGTGRSMALVNVAVELVKSGLRVLIVDFDLEAPGLDTFNLPRPPGQSKGIVDFVLEYLEIGKTPDVSDFVYPSPIPSESGKLWVMPSGGSHSEYDRRFKSINWRELYESHDGYLLFEDLKAQWELLYKPDYVLIDSRTGHTDVSGICTRQLPDTTLLFFFPNEQNRRGLQTVVRQIRAEADSLRKKKIDIHFVMSNVPELDDEEGVLEANLTRIKESLEFDELSSTIHHYPSLALLTQSVFALDRPRTRLAQEYAELAQVIRRANLADRQVALEFLDLLAPRTKVNRLIAEELEQNVDKILEKHSDDPEILIRLAAWLRRQRRFEEALSILEQAGELGAKTAEFYLARAELRSINQDSVGGLQDIQSLLDTSDATYLEIVAAARFLLQRDSKWLSRLTSTRAFSQLAYSGKYYVTRELFDSRVGLAVAEDILLGLIEDSTTPLNIKRSASSNLPLALIGQGKYDLATTAITTHADQDHFTIDQAFNHAMARWGLDSHPSPELFRKVVELDKKEGLESANGHECLALALAIISESESALSRLNAAWQKIVTGGKPEFSCWSYLQLTTDPFLKDLDEIRQFIEGQALQPRFIREANMERTLPY